MGRIRWEGIWLGRWGRWWVRVGFGQGGFFGGVFFTPFPGNRKKEGLAACAALGGLYDDDGGYRCCCEMFFNVVTLRSTVVSCEIGFFFLSFSLFLFSKMMMIILMTMQSNCLIRGRVLFLSFFCFPFPLPLPFLFLFSLFLSLSLSPVCVCAELRTGSWCW